MGNIDLALAPDFAFELFRECCARMIALTQSRCSMEDEALVIHPAKSAPTSGAPAIATFSIRTVPLSASWRGRFVSTVCNLRAPVARVGAGERVCRRKSDSAPRREPLRRYKGWRAAI